VGNLRRLRRSQKINGKNVVLDRPGERAIQGFNYPGTGDYNGYTCEKCKAVTMVIHADPGVTPMFLGCKQPDCDGRAVSMGYPPGSPPKQLLPAKWEWYRPELDDPILKEPGMMEHVSRGGLALREL
jgi:hypothetical protein